METVDADELAVAKSCLPSLLKSPTAIVCGRLPTDTSGLAGDVNPPLPLPSRIETVLESLFAVPRSCLPSPFQSATTTARGLLPRPRLISAGTGDIKPPVPSPRRIDTFAEVEFAVAK